MGSQLRRIKTVNNTTNTTGITRQTYQDGRLYLLVYLPTLLALGHHLDHIIRGTHVGWPVTPEVTPFTLSLAIYPIILLGLILHRSGKVGSGFWMLVAGGGA